MAMLCAITAVFPYHTVSRLISLHVIALHVGGVVDTKKRDGRRQSIIFNNLTAIFNNLTAMINI